MKKIGCILLSFMLVIAFIMSLRIENKIETEEIVNLSTALNIAQEKALTWDLKAKPYFITSVDNNEKDILNGKDGKRSTWNFDFAIENTNKHLIMYLHNGKVIYTSELESYVDNSKLINTSKLNITSESAIHKAIKESNLLPGMNWANGYHFVMENIEEKPTLTVVGTNEREEIKKIRFDATQKFEIKNTSLTILNQKAKKVLNINKTAYAIPPLPLRKFTGQEVTCYVSRAGRKTSSGLTPEIGHVAVHPKEWGNHLQPLIYFGETIITEISLNAPNANMVRIFNVQDIGEVNNENNRTKYWFDIYIGLNTAQNIKWGLRWGTKYNVTYYIPTWTNYPDRDA